MNILEEYTKYIPQLEGQHTCPRRAEGNGVYMKDEDVWDIGNCCSYCGSLNPDELMRRLEIGDIELEPTDKNYKVYVSNLGGIPFKQTCRDSEKDPGGNDPSKWVWVTRDMDQTKFYFQHLSKEQQDRFIELHNSKEMHIGYPARFYVKPYFATYKN